MNRYALLTLLLFACAPAYAEVPAPLAPYITADEFRAAGLHRLTPEELERFERWFLHTVGAETAVAAEGAPTHDAEPEAELETELEAALEAELEAERRQLAEERRALAEERQRLEQAAAEPDKEHPGLFGFGALATSTPEIEAHLDGTFTGWSPGTRFRLDNGQVWESVGGDGFRPVRPLERPGVTIRRAAFGSFILRVEGYNASVRVRRIE